MIERVRRAAAARARAAAAAAAARAAAPGPLVRRAARRFRPSLTREHGSESHSVA